MAKLGKFFKSRGTSQKEVAKLLNITETSLSNKINGKQQFKQAEIKNLVEHFSMTWEEVKELFL